MSDNWGTAEQWAKELEARLSADGKPTTVSIVIEGGEVAISAYRHWPDGRRYLMACHDSLAALQDDFTKREYVCEQLATGLERFEQREEISAEKST